MLTLNSMTLYFYSRIVSNNNQEPPPKNRKPNSISTWIDNIEPNAPPPSRASSTTCTLSKLPPSLMAGSTHSSNSVLTNAIKVTQNTQVAATNIKREYAYIEVEDDGTLSDYNETTAQEREKALTSPFKNTVCATSSVSHSYIYILIKHSTIIRQNMVTKDWSKSVMAPKASKPFKKSDLPDGLNYEIIHCTVIPTVIAYYAHQKDPWDRPQSILCNKICIILRSAGGVDFKVDPEGPIYKNVCMINHFHHSILTLNLRLLNVCLTAGELLLALSHWHLSRHTSSKIKSLSLLHRNGSHHGPKRSSPITASCI